MYGGHADTVSALPTIPTEPLFQRKLQNTLLVNIEEPPNHILALV